ncbi:serine/threonine-protein phosphatase 7 [Hordeum vulgare]|nr:serine/threonine-protein phosphatase 7 [Hordeum vulgare]
MSFPMHVQVLMVWLLNDAYDVEHHAYLMSEKEMVIDLALELINPVIEPGEVLPNVNGIHLVIAGELCDHHVVGVESTLHHPLALEDLLLHCFEPRLHTSGLLRTLNITDVQHPLTHLNGLRVFQHFRETYAHVYKWYVISRTIFAYNTGKNAPWMWLKASTIFANKFSWGSAALAYLYRELDDACCRSTKDDGIGGCVFLLSVWSLERLPIGSPKAATWKPWDDHDNLVRLPTWAYKWDVVSEVASDVNLLYKQYTNEMDSLTTEQKQGKKLRCLSSILGCRDPEFSAPSRSSSSHRNTLNNSTSLGARLDDGDITSGAHLEDDVDTPEVEDEMTLKAFQCSAYMLKSRKDFKWYSPDDYANKEKNPVAGSSHLSRMIGMDDEDDDDDDLDEPEPVVRRKNLASKRGRGPK